MFRYYTEMMLRSYFTAEVTAGRFCEDRAALFSAFARIFLLDEEERERLFALVQSEEISSITSELEYYRYCRMKQYLALCGEKQEPPTELEEIATLKGSAILSAVANRLVRGPNEVRLAVYDNLVKATEEGSVLALYLLGVFQTEGFAFGKESKNGLRCLRKAAEWDGEEGLLAALRYDPAGREKYLACLYGRLSRAGRLELFQRASEVYGGFDSAKHREYRLLERAFDQGVIKREFYSKPYARIIYSEILSEKDKEAIVLSPNKEFFVEANALPLKLTFEKGEFQPSALKEVRSDRPEEIKKIARSLGNIDVRRMSSYRPLCIVSDSRFMLERYARAMEKGFGGARVTRIELGDLDRFDIEPAGSNIFVGSCDEDEFNCFFLFFRGDLAEEVADEAIGFLQSAKRSCFRLVRPAVTLDLSAVLPVCFCERKYASLLKPYCDTVRISAPAKQEKLSFLAELLSDKGLVYGTEIAMESAAAEKLAEYKIDEAESIVDEAICENRGETVVLTEELMRPYLESPSKKRAAYGFGGSIHDDNE